MRLAHATLLGIAVLLAGCASAPTTAPSETGRPGGYYQDDGPGDSPPANLAAVPDAQPKDEPLHKYANQPYVVLGERYVPDASAKPYKARGLASWYGRKFHGRKTASGEPYDMYGMSAAHRTLPIPSYARVTNTRSGTSVVVRLNDRGPFHPGRVIDLSYTAALKLNLLAVGSTQVEVERVFPAEAREGALAAADPRAPTSEESIVAAPPSNGGLFVQLGAFVTRASAESFRDRLKNDLAWLDQSLQILIRDGLYRVRLGPYATRAEATAVADRIRAAVSLVPHIAVQ